MNGIEKEIRECSDNAFRNHIIQELARDGVVRCWRCGQPDTGVYAFWITTYPGTIVVSGDIGELIVERHYDMLPWCRGSVDSTSYFAEKVPHAIKTTAFSEDRCREWINEELANLRGEEWRGHCHGISPGSDHEKTRDRLIEVLTDAMDSLDVDTFGADQLYHATYEVWQSNDPPDFMDWNANFLWCRDAIRWFVRHHDEREIERPERKEASLPQ